jgi:hypothetical protein
MNKSKEEEKEFERHHQNNDNNDEQDDNDDGVDDLMNSIMRKLTHVHIDNNEKIHHYEYCENK